MQVIKDLAQTELSCIETILQKKWLDILDEIIR